MSRIYHRRRVILIRDTLPALDEFLMIQYFTLNANG